MTRIKGLLDKLSETDKLNAVAVDRLEDDEMGTSFCVARLRASCVGVLYVAEADDGWAGEACTTFDEAREDMIREWDDRRERARRDFYRYGIGA